MFRDRHTINKYLAALLLLFIPLYPKFPLIAVAGSKVFIRLDDFLVLFVLIVWLFVNNGRIFSLLKLKLTRAIILFLAVGMFSIVSGYLLTHTVSIPIAFVHWLRR